jgi:hypothetical protein
MKSLFARVRDGKILGKLTEGIWTIKIYDVKSDGQIYGVGRDANFERATMAAQADLREKLRHRTTS